MGPFKTDSKAPTVTLATIPARITTPNHLLSWQSDDGDGAGVAENQLRYQINSGVWTAVSGVSDPSIESFQFNFPGGQHGDMFTICLKVVDRAGWLSEESCSATRYSPNPEFNIIPQTINQIKVYSNTVPVIENLYITNIGGDMLNWTATTPTTWTLLSADTGIAPSTPLITVTHPLTIGIYTNVITFTGPISTYNNPQVVTVTINAVRELHSVYLSLVRK